VVTKAGVRFATMNLVCLVDRDPYDSSVSLESSFHPATLNLSREIRLFLGVDDRKQAKLVTDVLFPQQWLNAKDSNDEKGRTHREVSEESYLWRLQTARKQFPLGAISQLWAALTHSVSPERLKTISEVIPSILIVTGDEDNLIWPVNSRYLHERLPGSQYEVFKGCGHGLPAQDPPRFNALLEAFIARTNARLAGSADY